jgi:hypothetical protein
MALSQSTSDAPVCTILEQETYDRYGYWPLELSPGTARHIIILCSMCGKQRSIRRNGYRPDLLCRLCAYKKRSRHGMWNTSTYHIWQGIKQRCYDLACAGYTSYGGRGITVCDAWRNSFIKFLADVGPRPGPSYQLDRIDNNGNYEPGNVRWATPSEQQNNTRNNRHITLGRRTQTLVQWSRELKIPETTIAARLNRGWTVEEALGLIARKRKKRRDAGRTRKYSEVQTG